MAEASGRWRPWSSARIPRIGGARSGNILQAHLQHSEYSQYLRKLPHRWRDAMDGYRNDERASRTGIARVAAVSNRLRIGTRDLFAGPRTSADLWKMRRCRRHCSAATQSARRAGSLFYERLRQESP